jgi:hypothetical protein
MSDIVERLHKIAETYDQVGWHDDVYEAAGEIERLRELVKKLTAEMDEIARIALAREGLS